MLGFILLHIATATASTDGGVQLALYEPGVAFAKGFIDGKTFDIEEPRIEAEVSCYTSVGIENLNIHIPIQTVDLLFEEGVLVVDVFFDPIHGEDMVIFAEDDNWTDACVAFETELHYLRMEQLRLRLGLNLWIEDNAVQIAVAGSPIVTGDIDMDIAWVPDDLILSFVEDRIFEAVADKMAESIPDLVGEYLDSTLFAQEVGPLGVAMELVDIDLEPHALRVGMDIDVDWNGDACEMPAAAPVEGRSPALNLSNSEGSGIGVGITELQLNQMFHSAWSDGLLCFDDGPLEGALDAIGDGLGAEVSDAQVNIAFGAPPSLRIDDNRLRLSLDNFGFEFTGKVDGQDTSFVALEANIDAAVELRVDHAVSSLVLDLVYAKLDITTIDADTLVTDRDGAEERLVAFIEDWVMDVVSDRVGSIVLYGNTFHAADVYIRVDTLQAENGGLVTRASLFHADDPLVDTEAPNTSARLNSMNADTMEVGWMGEDNKTEGLAFSYRLDDDDWSSWTAEPTATIELPEPGAHTMLVRARDSWMNVDPTPALLAFEVTDPADNEKQGCMCSATSARGTRLAWLGLVPLLWMRRRH